MDYRPGALSDALFVHILRYIPRNDLGRIGMVNRLLHRLSFDTSLWPTGGKEDIFQLLICYLDIHPSMEQLRHLLNKKKISERVYKIRKSYLKSLCMIDKDYSQVKETTNTPSGTYV